MSKDVTEINALPFPPRTFRSTVRTSGDDPIPSIDYSLSCFPRSVARRVVSIYPPNRSPEPESEPESPLELAPPRVAVQSNNRLSVFPPPRTETGESEPGQPDPYDDDDHIYGEIAEDNSEIIGLTNNIRGNFIMPI